MKHLKGGYLTDNADTESAKLKLNEGPLCYEVTCQTQISSETILSNVGKV
jgi:hypothetical protein